jgi:hypothetical protein
MTTILILAKDKDSADQAETKFTTVQVRKVYPGVKNFPHVFDAVVYYHNEESDYEAYPEEKKRYENAPLKASFGTTVHPAAAGEGLKSFTSAEETVAFLQAEHTTLLEQIKKVFDALDSDQSGYIDLNELKAVSKELGRELTDAEIESSIKELDENKDGKISFEEFKHWWFSGRQNLSPLMKRFINLIIKTQKLITVFNAPILHALESNPADEEVGTSSVTLNLNKFEQAGTTINVKVSLLSPSQKEEYNRIKFIHKFPQLPEFLTEVVVSFAVEIKDGKVDEAKEALNTIVSTYLPEF